MRRLLLLLSVLLLLTITTTGDGGWGRDEDWNHKAELWGRYEAADPFVDPTSLDNQVCYLNYTLELHDDGSGNVDTWGDQYGSNDAVQTTAARRPLIGGANGVYFDSVNDEWLDIANLTTDLPANDFSVYIVTRSTVNTSRSICQSKVLSPYATSWMIHYDPAGGSIVWFRTETLGVLATIGDNANFYSTTMRWDRSAEKFTLYTDNAYIGESAAVAGYTTEGSVKLGAAGDGLAAHWTGFIRYLIITSDILTPAEIAHLNTYFGI